MHSLKELDDGRYNKVANVVGHTMQYHHTGMQVSVMQYRWSKKNYWLTAETGVISLLEIGAAASRYIEARLSKFALGLFTVLKSLTGDVLWR
jgi:topoisomerase-4 subunit A